MKVIDLWMPSCPEGRATILRWQKAEGDRVERGEGIAELADGQGIFDLRSPEAGMVLEILAEDGALVEVGESLATIRIP